MGLDYSPPCWMIYALYLFRQGILYLIYGNLTKRNRKRRITIVGYQNVFPYLFASIMTTKASGDLLDNPL